MTSPKHRNIISLVFTCLCISKALLIKKKKDYSKMDYSPITSKELTQICKERKIQYAMNIRKQEMSEILSQKKSLSFS